MLKKIAARLIPLNIRKQLRNFHILANQYGQYRTIQKGFGVDKEGSHLPWYTYPAIEYLCNIDFTTKKSSNTEAEPPPCFGLKGRRK